MGTTFPDAFPTPHPGQPAGVGTFVPGHPYASTGPFNGHATLADDLVSYWALDEESGTRYDSVGSNDLTDNNTVGFTAVTGPPNFPGGKAASFVEASNEYLSKAAWLHGASFTYSAWIRSNGTANYDTILATNLSTFNSNVQVAFYTTVGGVVVGFCSPVNGSGGVQVTANVADISTGWHLAILWFDETDQKLRISVDDSEATGSAVSTATTGTFKSASTLTIGSANATTDAWDGELAHIGYWTRPLTAQERTDLYNSGAGLFYGD